MGQCKLIGKDMMDRMTAITLGMETELGQDWWVRGSLVTDHIAALLCRKISNNS